MIIVLLIEFGGVRSDANILRSNRNGLVSLFRRWANFYPCPTAHTLTACVRYTQSMHTTHFDKPSWSNYRCNFVVKEDGEVVEANCQNEGESGFGFW